MKIKKKLVGKIFESYNHRIVGVNTVTLCRANWECWPYKPTLTYNIFNTFIGI